MLVASDGAGLGHIHKQKNASPREYSIISIQTKNGAHQSAALANLFAEFHLKLTKKSSNSSPRSH